MAELNSTAVQIPESFRRYLKQHMTEDHERLEALLDDAACLAEHRSFYTAAKKFEDFRMREEQHISVEEASSSRCWRRCFPIRWQLLK